MNLEDFKDLEIGDRIEFRSITRHTNRKAIRKITGFPTDYFSIELSTGEFKHTRSLSYAEVRYEGCPGFLVRRNEIIRRPHE